ncbi:hypothetical protein [Mycobacterium sp. 1245111.1]|uniref:hypothetical protein n=1 Tax=Mycobacterium sp. 1245111.1 TaxID=1834073 RepID=UPI0012EA0299|nr:hypothetical protein [Mycobacterium sp. 1245111.1]
MFELPERLWSGAHFDHSGHAEVIALKGKREDFYSVRRASGNQRQQQQQQIAARQRGLAWRG